jgi:hypothetical protein
MMQSVFPRHNLETMLMLDGALHFALTTKPLVQFPEGVPQEANVTFLMLLPTYMDAPIIPY